MILEHLIEVLKKTIS